MSEPTFDGAVVATRLQDTLERVVALLPLLAIALLLVAVAWVFGGWLSRRQILSRAGRRNPFLESLVRTTVRWVVVAVAATVALQILQATALIGAVLGTAGVMGVALGFAFKDTLENYLAGILMSLRQPFAPRDHVVIDGHEGRVILMNARATILMTLDGNHLRLPNALVFRSVMLNYTRNPNRRFTFDVGIGVGEDLVAAQQLGIEALRKVDGVVAEPPPRAYITDLGDSNVQVRFHGWMDQRSHDFQLVKSEAIRRVKLELEAHGMDLPEPIYRVQLTERSEATRVVDTPPASPEATRRQRRAAQAEHVDTRAVTDLDTQMTADARDRPRGGGDLLDTDAPTE